MTNDKITEVVKQPQICSHISMYPDVASCSEVTNNSHQFWTMNRYTINQ